MPKVYAMCNDPSIIGTTFYVCFANISVAMLICIQVMEFVKGRIITDPDLGDLSPDDRRKA